MPKTTAPVVSRQARRHNPLEDDITATGLLRNKPSKKRSRSTQDADDSFVDSKASQNILRIGRELADEEKAERRGAAVPEPTVDNFGYDSRFDDAVDEQGKTYDDDEAWGDDDEVVEEMEVEPEDLETYKKFMPDDEDDLLKHGWDRKPSGPDEGESVNLADLILQKIAAHEAAEARKEAGLPVDDYELPPKVVEAYTKWAPPALTS